MKGASCVVFFILQILLVSLMVSSHDHHHQRGDDGDMFIPAVDPRTNQIIYFNVLSNMLLQDPYRNPHLDAVINSFSDFINFPNIGPNSHFIAISNTGYGMAIAGETADEINDEIESIVSQLPADVRKVTFYQRKDENRFPQFNVYTGPYARNHLPPHQNYYRAN